MKLVDQAKINFDSSYSIEDIERFTAWFELDSILTTLPIGIKHNNIFLPNTEYKTQVFTGNHEIALGELEDSYGKDNILRILQNFIPEILPSIDSIAISPSIIGQMYVADVIAIVTNIRIAGQHWGVPISCTCPCDRALEIKPTCEDDYHDLRGLKFRVWQGDREPIFAYKLLRPIGDIEVIKLSPPKLEHVFDSGFRESELAQESKISILLSDINEDIYEQLSRVDRENLKNWAEQVNTIGMELAIEMYCPECDEEWKSPLVLGVNHPDFILSLLQAPRGETGDARDYIFELVKFMTFGEQAPFKSASEILNLTPKIRNNLVESLAKNYKDQARKMRSK